MKRSTAFELALPPRDARVPTYLWLYASLRKEILDRRLRPGMRLPATRDIAAQYGLSRGTIVQAFELLKSEGFVEGTVGSGTFVSNAFIDDSFASPRESGSSFAAPRAVRHVSEFARRLSPFDGFEMRPSRAFRANLPALDLFPAKTWGTIAAHRWRHMTSDLLMGCDALGYAPLREAVADYLTTSRGVRCAAAQVAIVSGVQEALDLVARLFIDPGDRVYMESPGYLGAALAFEAAGAKISGAAIDGEGMAPTKAACRNARLFYVTPGHQFPLGVTMSLGRRLALLEIARQSGALIFEDDYDSEFRYGARPTPALQGLDSNNSVLYCGTFSKVLFPSLRLGYLVIPTDLVPYVAAAKSISTRHAQLIDQAVLCDFFVEGHFARHFRRMRDVYAERFGALREESQRRLSGMLEVSAIEAGLQTIGWLKRGVDAEAARVAAAARDVEVNSLASATRGRVREDGILLGFAAVDAKEIRRGVRDLAIALEPLSSG